MVLAGLIVAVVLVLTLPACLEGLCAIVLLGYELFNPPWKQRPRRRRRPARLRMPVPELQIEAYESGDLAVIDVEPMEPVRRQPVPKLIAPPAPVPMPQWPRTVPELRRLPKAPVPSSVPPKPVSAPSPHLDDLVSAVRNLGYPKAKATEIAQAAIQASPANATFETLILAAVHAANGRLGGQK